MMSILFKYYLVITTEFLMFGLVFSNVNRLIYLIKKQGTSIAVMGNYFAAVVGGGYLFIEILSIMGYEHFWMSLDDGKIKQASTSLSCIKILFVQKFHAQGFC